MKHFFLLILFVSILSLTSNSKIVLPEIFSDNMVLQQNSKVAIWGWAEAGQTVKIVASWNNDTVKAVANNSAKWETNLSTINAGGPYNIEIIGSNKHVLKNVMLGEVWLCSGQSNMEWSVNAKIMNGEEEAALANFPNIRIFHIQKMGAEFPQQFCEANWTECTPKTMRATSAVGYFFARHLTQKLNVPVGIIVSAWGGTPAEVWIEKNRILNNPDLEKSKYKEVFKWWPGEAGSLYNSMIYPLIPYNIAGAIWYQGESNCGNYQIYSELMKTLIENWRNDFKKDFPFYFVQIAPYNYGENGTSEFLREQQDIASKKVPNTGMVVVSDLVDNIKDIHPLNKQDVGKRLANYALSETYKINVGDYKSPAYNSMKVENGKIVLSFNNASSGLKCSEKTPLKFLISGDDKNFVVADAKIVGETIILSSKLVKTPVAARFCFDDTSVPDVFSNSGLPLAPFRTDNW